MRRSDFDHCWCAIDGQILFGQSLLCHFDELAAALTAVFETVGNASQQQIVEQSRQPKCA